MAVDAVDTTKLSPDSGGRLASPSYLGLLATQFLGALNDNMFRWLVVPIAKPVLGDAAALSLGLACFTVPYLLLASPAGYLADKLSKRKVIVGCKIAEILIMALGVAAIWSGSATFLFVVVGLMGAQSALFGPSKFGSIPELVDSDRISKANGFMALITVVASALGFIAGSTLFEANEQELRNLGGFSEMWAIPAALIGVALIGWLASLSIRAVPAADPQRAFPVNPFAETWASLRRLGSNRPLMRAALGIGFFWLLASLAQMNIDAYGIEELKRSQGDIGLLLGILVLGLGAGSVLAGYWSSGRVELGIVPLGALGIVVSGWLLYVSGSHINPSSLESLNAAYVWSCIWLFLLGVSAGLFNIPLEAFLQQRSDRQHRGMILAAGNFLAFSLILFSSGLFYVLKERLDFVPSQIFLVAALGTIPVLIYIVFLLPGATLRFIVWLFAHTIYRLRVYGKENVPATGGALLVANHVSWIDGVLLLLTSSRPIRMLAYADYVSNWKLRWLSRLYGVIPIKDTAGPKELLKSLQAAREAIQGGDLVCIFAEGNITRTGQLQPFSRGLLHIVKGTDAPVVPVYLDGLWGSIFSYRGGKVLWKRPREWPYPVAVSFGTPIEKPNDVHQVRSAVQNLGVESMEHGKENVLLPARRFLRMCRRNRVRNKIADTSGAELTGGKLLTAALAFQRVLERNGVGEVSRTLPASGTLAFWTPSAKPFSSHTVTATTAANATQNTRICSPFRSNCDRSNRFAVPLS
jgi:acyl-[acyl-carrier-protein]-phospholipid O-acyltransferase/long-chain-fatty-acid--[acyl-carrier-protein] ligase